MTQKEIKQMYREWRRENNNKKPNRAIIKMYWEDESPDNEKVDTIAIKRYDVDVKDDAWILWYSGGLRGIVDLLKPNNGSDFILTEVLEFYKI